MKLAPIVGQPIPKSVASSSLLSHIATSKYCHHLPLYRQEQIWRSLDVHIARNSMCRWMIQVGELLSPLIAMQFKEMKRHGVMHADETPVSVLQESCKGDKPSHQGYMWVYVNEYGVIYDYRSGRGSACVMSMLGDYRGYVQSDGYAGYNELFRTGDRISVGCMAHARRKFVDVHKASGKVKSGVAWYVLKQMQKLYKLERSAKEGGLDEIEVYRMRQEEAVPILDKLHHYLLDKYPTIPPRGVLGKAIGYMLNQFDSIRRYTESGLLDIDNSVAERAIKPFAVGRKNWLFCGNSKGAVASANIYSMIESAKYYRLKVFEYLKYVLEALPQAKTEEQLRQLLPVNAQHYLPKIN